jgi:hypothetical protein
MVNVVSSHLQAEAATYGRPSPIIRAAPTGVASNQIGGQTLHSLLRLPIDGNLRSLSETPTVLRALQRRFRDVHYLVIDEKSMLGLKTFGWIDQRLREVFPERRDDFFGGLSVILIGDFFQLPPVLNKPLYSTVDDLKDIEIVGRNAYRSFTKTVFLTTIQRQQGEDQAPFRRALEELRKQDVSVASWQLLSSRCSVKLSPDAVDSFNNALRIFPTRDQVNKYNHEHMLGLASPAILAEASHEGNGADKVSSSLAGNLVKTLPLSVGCRVMLTRNLWGNVGLVNGAQGTVYDISWGEGADVLRDPPEVVMVAFDEYAGPSFTMPDGEPLRSGEKLVVPILRVRQDFMIGGDSCYREQFPLVVSYAITVHKSQGITLDKAVCDISVPEFASGLCYVAVSRVKTLGGLLLENPFDRSRVYRQPPTPAMKMKLLDYAARQLQVLEDIDDDDRSDESVLQESSDEEGDGFESG